MSKPEAKALVERLRQAANDIMLGSDGSPYWWGEVSEHAADVIERLTDAISPRPDESGVEWRERISQVRRELGLTVDGSLEGVAAPELPTAPESSEPFPSDTPLTDAASVLAAEVRDDLFVVTSEFARQLERERAAQPPGALQAGLERAVQIIESIETPADQYEPYKTRLVDALCDAIYTASTKESPPPEAWQPIETAPKDGSLILALTSEYGPLPLRWGEFGEGSIAREEWKRGKGPIGGFWWSDPIRKWTQTCEAMHWLPLPAESPTKGASNG